MRHYTVWASGGNLLPADRLRRIESTVPGRLELRRSFVPITRPALPDGLARSPIQFGFPTEPSRRLPLHPFVPLETEIHCGFAVDKTVRVSYHLLMKL
jgi:hypothetical protein